MLVLFLSSRSILKGRKQKKGEKIWLFIIPSFEYSTSLLNLLLWPPAIETDDVDLNFLISETDLVACLRCTTYLRAKHFCLPQLLVHLRSQEIESYLAVGSCLLLSKVGDYSRGWPEGSLLDSYYTKV